MSTARQELALALVTSALSQVTGEGKADAGIRKAVDRLAAEIRSEVLAELVGVVERAAPQVEAVPQAPPRQRRAKGSAPPVAVEARAPAPAVPEPPAAIAPPADKAPARPAPGFYARKDDVFAVGATAVWCVQSPKLKTGRPERREALPKGAHETAAPPFVYIPAYVWD